MQKSFFRPHVLVSAGISRLLDTCLSGINNANYIVNSIVCAVILVCGSQVPAYGIWPMHGPIHILFMHGTGTKHIVRHSQKYTCISCLSFLSYFHITDDTRVKNQQCLSDALPDVLKNREMHKPKDGTEKQGSPKPGLQEYSRLAQEGIQREILHRKRWLYSTWEHRIWCLWSRVLRYT